MIEYMALRPTTVSDQELIGNLLAASYPILMREAYPDDVLQQALPAMTRANLELLSSDTFYMVEEANGQAVGCGGWTLERPGTGQVEKGLAHVRHFATHPAFTGNGIGRTIFQHCAEQARMAGVARFECYSSLNAEGFYASLGFVSVEQFDVQMGPTLNFSAVRMMCAL